MKRLFLFGCASMLASVLSGCPIFDDDGRHGNECFYRDDCYMPPGSCQSSNDCGVNETCGADEQCHPGDCTIWGCPGAEECVVDANGAPVCSSDPSSSSSNSTGTGGSGTGTGGSGGANAGGGGSGGGGDIVYCGNPDDCSDGETCAPDVTCKPGDCTMVECIFGYSCDASAATPQCTPIDPNACGSDDDCQDAGAGYACVNGECTAPQDQCFDQTQCGAAQVCAAGKCIDSCTADRDCPIGYACNLDLGICSVPSPECTITNDCGGPDAVCVDGACVPRSEGGSCPPGEVWVENGCIPNQSASFVCDVDGEQGACAAGSICLHHSCYISCEEPNATACDNLTTFDVCKTVTTSSGAHAVCGSDDNLGGECDPGASGCAAGEVCIDGFCK